jgi:hypothetical protein
MQKQKQIKVGHLDVPEDYFSMPKEDRQVVCNTILESILYILERHINDDRVDKLNVLNRLIDSSIITNQHEENYEVCGVLMDIRNLINA